LDFGFWILDFGFWILGFLDSWILGFWKYTISEQSSKLSPRTPKNFFSPAAGRRPGQAKYEITCMTGSGESYRVIFEWGLGGRSKAARKNFWGGLGSFQRFDFLDSWIFQISEHSIKNSKSPRTKIQNTCFVFLKDT
jgi:hypothetical protein